MKTDTRLTVFTKDTAKSYTISRYNYTTKTYDSIPIPNDLGLLILELYSCTLYKVADRYTIYNLGKEK